ncbi:MAG TPA: hypothetical protein VGK89_02330 [Candidatus Eisenbacteria bacterium]
MYQKPHPRAVLRDAGGHWRVIAARRPADWRRVECAKGRRMIPPPLHAIVAVARYQRGG